MVWYDHTDGWISRQSKITPVRNASALDGSVRGSGIYSFDVWIAAGITDGGFRYIKGNDWGASMSAIGSTTEVGPWDLSGNYDATNAVNIGIYERNSSSSGLGWNNMKYGFRLLGKR